MILFFLIQKFSFFVSADNNDQLQSQLSAVSTDSKAGGVKRDMETANDSKVFASTSSSKFSFIHAFFASLSVIVVSEIGDKTFFIAAIMAMKHSRFTIYMGAMLALGLMTLLSALLGNILTKIIPKKYTYYASSFLFALFGLKMLREGYQMSHTDASEEYEEASSTLRESEEKNAADMAERDVESGNGGGDSGYDPKSWKLSTRKLINLFRKYVSTIFLQAFFLTFLAEWGDRSQISTIILGARENMIGTVLGGTIGHGLCTGLAVIGGRMIAQRISVKTVTLVGALVFLFFAFSAFFIDPDSY
jgi:putative Ca2+/H+ antiporter (TMEM165/GDT1 family)